MDTLARVHVASDSFRREYTIRPPGFRTPPPPTRDVEPLSPVFAPAHLADPSSPDLKRRRYQEPENYRARWERASSKPSKDPPRKLAATAPPPLSTPSHPRPAPYYGSQLSPTALDVFAAVATSPDLGQDSFSPSARASARWSPPHHNVTSSSSAAAARGSRRSRSEVINFRPQQPDPSRPSTSYRDSSASSNKHPLGLGYTNASPRHTADRNFTDSSVTDTRIEEAELLLGFARAGGADRGYHHPPTSRYAAHTTPSSTKSDAHQAALGIWPSQRVNGPNYDIQSPWSRPMESNRMDKVPPKVYGSSNTAVNGTIRPTEGYSANSRSEISTNPTGAMHSWPVKESPQDPPKKPRVHKGWPKGKPRGKRTTTATATQTKKSTTKRATKAEKIQQGQTSQPTKPAVASMLAALEDYSLPKRPKTATGHEPMSASTLSIPSAVQRASSVPRDILMVGPHQKTLKSSAKTEAKLSLCTLCGQTESPNGFHELWITCNGCREWFHTVCVGFKNEREVRDVDKFYCPSCEPKHGQTTFVRKSSRAHASVDYAGLNEGQIRTSIDTIEHHFIQPIKDGTLQFLPEKFPRMPPELVTAEFFERSGTMSEPVLIPASMNPRPVLPGQEFSLGGHQDSTDPSSNDETPGLLAEEYEYDCVPDDGQDKLDMVMPQGLTVRHVAELLGPERPVQVIDVKSQDQGDTTWNLRKWADYYEAPGEKPVRNVISLEVSQTKLSRLIRRPKIVRDLDLQDHVWPQEELDKGSYPHVQFYCLMSVADCYTDFHIDFGGSSVYYHILRGKKTFFFIPPKKQHLKKYEEWCISPNQESIFLGNVTKECYRVDLSEGDTMLIPSGWIHAVWTPENSLVIGGNFLTRMHYGMQIQINEIEKNTGVARMFRYPSFQKVQWYTVIQYLQKDPVPSTVAQILYGGGKFHRESPVYFDFELTPESEEANHEYFNARYYSQGEIEGLGELLNFVFRTVMISLGLVPIAKTSQEAVVRSLPKGYGDHLDILKTFALWIAWKRGNEELPTWAHPEAPISELEAAIVEKKTAAGTGKKTDREANKKMTTPERRSQRQTPKGKDVEAQGQASRPTVDEDPSKAISESSQGTRRIWCEACRRSRVRCKHREPGDQPDNTERFGIKGITVSPGLHPLSMNDSTPLAEPNPEHVSSQALLTPISQTMNGQQGELESGRQTPVSSTPNGTPQTSNTQVRIKACEECRKSKRRCIHDADGNIDPVKALQNPVQRAFYATKRMRHDRSTNGAPPAKKMKTNLGDTDVKAGENHEDHPAMSDLNANYSEARDPPNHEPSPAASQKTNLVNGVESKAPQGDATSDQNDWHMRPTKSPNNFPAQDGQGDDPVQLPVTDHMDTSRDNAANDGSSLALNDAEKELKLFEQDHNNNEAPANQSISENRSRTPSLHVQTNSTESLDRSRSPPTSPLTDMDPSSPVLPKQEDQMEDVLQEDLSTLKQPDQPKYQTTSSTSQKVETNALRTPLKPQDLIVNKSSGKSSRKSASKRYSNTSRSVSMETGALGQNGSPGRAMSAKSQAMSPSEETVEEESMRLARQLQEQEFGLRRRSK